MQLLARPIFVLGPLRSGASLLGWSLSLHGRLMAVPDGTSIGCIAAGLHTAVDDGRLTSWWPAVLPDSDALCATLGETLNELVLRGTAPAGETRANAPSPGGADRWCDATPGHALHALPLQRLFPRARFIHVARDVHSAVRAMVDRQLGKIDSRAFTPWEAERHWLETTRASLLAERALGPDSVLRVQREDLIANPEPTVRRCLEFVGEPFDTACLWPLKAYPAEFQHVVPPKRLVGHWTASRESRELSRRLVKGLPWPRDPASAARAQLEALSARRLPSSVCPPSDPRGGDTAAERLCRLAVTVTTPGATLLVISRGDPRLVTIPDRVGWHFPQTDEGVYAGHHPSDGHDAIAHLEALRHRGAAYLVIPWDESWWLDHYDEFATHLCRHYGVAAYEEGTGLVIALGQEAARAGQWRVALHTTLTRKTGGDRRSSPDEQIA